MRIRLCAAAATLAALLPAATHAQLVAVIDEKAIAAINQVGSDVQSVSVAVNNQTPIIDNIARAVGTSGTGSVDTTAWQAQLSKMQTLLASGPFGTGATVDSVTAYFYTTKAQLDKDAMSTLKARRWDAFSRASRNLLAVSSYALETVTTSQNDLVKLTNKANAAQDLINDSDSQNEALLAIMTKIDLDRYLNIARAQYEAAQAIWLDPCLTTDDLNCMASRGG